MIVVAHCRKTLLAAGFIILLVASQIAAAQAAQSSPVTLKRTFKSGTVEKYSNTSAQEMAMLPGERITTTGDLVMTYGKVEGGTADVVGVSSNIKVEGLGELPPGLMPKEIRTTGKIDAQNVMADISSDPVAPGGAASPLTEVAFPLKPVSPGDKWKSTLSSYESQGFSGEIENTYVGETDFAGKPAYRITFEGHFKPSNTPAAQANPLAAMMGATTMDVTGEVLLDKTDCSILSATTISAAKGSMSMGGQTMDMSQKIQTTQKRVN